jgi:maltose/moltooligosaccharide transporter
MDTLHLTKGILFLIVVYYFQCNLSLRFKERLVYVLSLGLIGLGGLAMLVSDNAKNNTTDNGFVTIMNDFQFMPKHETMAWVQFFSWFALCGFDGYTTLYGDNFSSEAYNTGANQVGEMFANYNFAALAAFFYYHY